MRILWNRFLALLARLNGIGNLRGLRWDDRACCVDLDAARSQRRQALWESERCGL